MNKSLPAWLWSIITVILVLVIGFLDWVTGYALHFFLSYLIPVVIAAWFIGLNASVATSFLCCIVWLAAELLSGQDPSSYFHLAWNTLIRLVSFLIVGAAISQIRRLIDRQRRLSEDLKRSITKYLTLYESTTDAVMLIDETGILDCNKAALKIFGITTKEELCSKSPADFSPSLQPDGTASTILSSRYIAEAFEKGTTRLEWLHKRMDNGEIFYVDVVLTAIVLDGKPVIQAVVRDITARKEVEKALQESEIKYRRITENMSGTIAEIDALGVIKYLSPSHERIFGQDPKELINRTVFDYIHPKDRDRVLAELQEGIRQKKDREAEYRYRHADGHYIWVSSSSNSVFDSDGRLIGSIINTIDITKRKQAEEALRKSEAKFREVYENIDDLYFETDAEGMIKLLSPSVRRLTGYSDEELIGKPVTSVYVHPEQSVRLRRKIFQASSVNDYELLMKKKNGESVYISIAAHVIADDKGQPVGIRGLLRNITERKKAEKALQEKEKSYRRIMENMSGTVGEINVTGVITYLSPSHLKIFGENPENLIGKTIFDYIHPEDLDRVVAELQEAVLQKTEREVEYRYRHADGHYIWVHSAGSTFYDSDGKVLGVVVNSRDITERKQAEEALRKSEAKFREVYENIDDIYFETDAEANISFLSPSVYRLTGYKEDEVVGTPVSDIYVHPEQNDEVLQKIMEEGAVNDYEFLVKKKDGGSWYASMTSHLVFDENGQAIGSRGVLRNITERKRAEEALRQSEAKFREVYETIDDMYFQTNPEGSITTLSPSVGRISGWTEEDLIGKPFTFVYVNPEDRKQLLTKLAQDGHVNDYELLLRKKNGEIFYASLTARRFFDEAGQAIGVRGLLRNITERKHAEERIRHMANHDGLTDLPSLRLANDRLSMAMSTARRDKTMAAVMFMDLDGFKKVNDSMGHDAGNYVLKQVARRLLSCVRETDTVARVGGDEFLLIVTRLHTSENASLLAEKVIKSISEPFIFKGQTATIGVSIGIALFPDHGEDRDQLIKRADDAMYSIKNSGKNGYSFAKSSK